MKRSSIDELIKYFSELLNDVHASMQLILREIIVKEKATTVFNLELEKMRLAKLWKIVGPDDILIDLWKCKGEMEQWLTWLIDKKFETRKMQNLSRYNTTISTYEKTSDIQSWTH